MSAGDKELRKAFEETTTNNIKAMLEHGNETRILFRETEKKVEALEGMVRGYQDQLAALQKQIAFLQQNTFKGGT